MLAILSVIALSLIFLFWDKIIEQFVMRQLWCQLGWYDFPSPFRLAFSLEMSLFSPVDGQWSKVSDD